MSVVQAQVPDVLPVLSRGKHRNPRKGACFMELASFLAGERWSDHPKCTHPLLADLARQVNDYTADLSRSALAVLIPSVIGTSTTDPRVDARIALLCAQSALPVVAAERQNVMAVGVIMADRVLAVLEGRDPGELSGPSHQSLAEVPLAAHYAQRYTKDAPVSPEAFRRHGAPHVVRLAVEGVATACVQQPNDLLREMLAQAIEVCAAAAEPSGGRPDVSPTSWATACQLTLSR